MNWGICLLLSGVFGNQAHAMSDILREPVDFDDILVTPLENLPVYDGILLPGFRELMIDAEKKISAIKNLESRMDDILLCTYPKSGTHWVAEIVAEIISGKAEYSKKTNAGLFLEGESFDKQVQLPSPRSFNSHLPFRMLPRKHFEMNAKTIHVIRNPKDVAVSYYHHLQKDPCGGAITMSWEDYFHIFINNIIYGTWFEYEKGWELVKTDNPGLNVLTLFYEDLKRDTDKGVKQISEYLGYSHSDQLIEQIAENVDFRNMSKKKYDISERYSIDKKPFVFRKGEIGDWKKYFTVAQNEQFDALYQKEMRDSKLRITFVK